MLVRRVATHSSPHSQNRAISLRQTCVLPAPQPLQRYSKAFSTVIRGKRWSYWSASRPVVDNAVLVGKLRYSANGSYIVSPFLSLYKHHDPKVYYIRVPLRQILESDDVWAGYSEFLEYHNWQQWTKQQRRELLPEPVPIFNEVPVLTLAEKKELTRLKQEDVLYKLDLITQGKLNGMPLERVGEAAAKLAFAKREALLSIWEDFQKHVVLKTQQLEDVNSLLTDEEKEIEVAELEAQYAVVQQYMVRVGLDPFETPEQRKSREAQQAREARIIKLQTIEELKKLKEVKQAQRAAIRKRIADHKRREGNVASMLTDNARALVSRVKEDQQKQEGDKDLEENDTVIALRKTLTTRSTTEIERKQRTEAAQALYHLMADRERQLNADLRMLLHKTEEEEKERQEDKLVEREFMKVMREVHEAKEAQQAKEVQEQLPREEAKQKRQQEKILSRYQALRALPFPPSGIATDNPLDDIEVDETDYEDDFLRFPSVHHFENPPPVRENPPSFPWVMFRAHNSPDGGVAATNLRLFHHTHLLQPAVCNVVNSRLGRFLNLDVTPQIRLARDRLISPDEHRETMRKVVDEHNEELRKKQERERMIADGEYIPPTQDEEASNLKEIAEAADANKKKTPIQLWQEKREQVRREEDRKLLLKQAEEGTTTSMQVVQSLVEEGRIDLARYLDIDTPTTPFVDDRYAQMLTELFVSRAPQWRRIPKLEAWLAARERQKQQQQRSREQPSPASPPTPPTPPTPTASTASPTSATIATETTTTPLVQV